MSTTRASHDLNSVHTVQISGWPGTYRIEGPETPNDTGIVIVSPKRHDGEFWTFAKQHAGVLKCHTSLLGSGNLVKIKPQDPLIIHLPEGVEVKKKSQQNGVITIELKK